MKYYRKQPVFAMQWNGCNQHEFTEFVGKFAGKTTSMPHKGYLAVAYYDRKKRLHRADVPDYGWVVVEGKTLQFYKDKTFRQTFKSAEDEGSKVDDKSEPSILDLARQTDKGSYKRLKEILDKSFEDMTHSKIMVDCFGAPTINVRRDVIDAIKEEARAANIRNRAQSLADFLQRGCISREEAEKHLVGGVTFDSVLDEMRDMHAKKNADYGDAAHVNFLKYGPVASLSRLSEKMQRAEHIFLSGKCEVKDEPLTATLIDMAITSAMLYVELKNQKK